MADAAIHGSVVDSSSQAALANVKVTLNPGGYEATSGADGTFSFTDLTAGEYTVTATLDGYTFEPNNFNVTLTPAQNYQTTLAATTSDVPGKNILGCAPFAVVIMTLLSLGFGSLSISCRKN
jgi:iron complex outermembrane receptor protein